MSDLYARVTAAAHSGAFGINELALPSAEQCRAGNYLKGRVKVQGMPLVIEVPHGQRRMGKSDGKLWSTILMGHYGYIAGTKGADGDELDVFVGPVPESSRVWVVNQVSKDGAFDEAKIMLGYTDEESARSAYMNSYERGWTGLGSMIACSIDQLKWWVSYGNTTIPLTERALPHDGTQDMNEIVWDSVTAEPVGCDMADLIYQLRRTDNEGLMLDAVTMAEIMEDTESEEVLDALVVPYVKVERKAEQLRKIMASIGGDVTPVSVQVTPPFKQRGTTHVVILFELSDGQTVSIWMHNPDSTPNRILPQDELVSWSWRLNKKDVSILVAPEKGQDLNPREVARRIMKLAQRNSARFAKANASRVQRMESIEGLKGEVSGKESALAALDALFNDLTEKVEAKRAFVPATLQGNDQSEIPQPVAEPVATVEPTPAVVQEQEPTPLIPPEPVEEPLPAVVAPPEPVIEPLPVVPDSLEPVDPPVATEPVQAVDSPIPDVAAAALAELQAQAAATGEDAELTAAKAFLHSVIDGNVDYYDPDLVGKLEAIHDAYTDIDEVMSLFNTAAQAFSDYMVEQTRAVI